MKQLTNEEKFEVAFLFRQEINEGEKTIKELAPTIETKEQAEIFEAILNGHETRKQRFQEIAKKLEIEL